MIKQSKVNSSIFFCMVGENKGFYIQDDYGSLTRISLLIYSHFNFGDGFDA